MTNMIAKSQETIRDLVDILTKVFEEHCKECSWADEYRIEMAQIVHDYEVAVLDATRPPKAEVEFKLKGSKLKEPTKRKKTGTNKKAV